MGHYLVTLFVADVVVVVVVIDVVVDVVGIVSFFAPTTLGSFLDKAEGLFESIVAAAAVGS